MFIDSSSAASSPSSFSSSLRSSSLSFPLPAPPRLRSQALQYVVDLSFPYSPPPFLTVFGHCMPISYFPNLHILFRFISQYFLRFYSSLFLPFLLSILLTLFCHLSFWFVYTILIYAIYKFNSICTFAVYSLTS